MSRHWWLPLLVLGASACRRPAPAPAASARAPVQVETVTVPVAPRPDRWTAAQRDSALAVLARHRAAWAGVRPRHYRYWEHGWCFCGMAWIGPRVVSVVNGRASDTAGRRSDPAYVRAAAQRPTGGIDALFDRIAEGIRDTAFAEVRAEFDPARGHPTRVTFDRALLDSDDEFHIDVSRVEALP
jgi:hypothetical protein